ncbi:MAG: extracellular solute-binding protein [Oscillospiraceae bacterium]|nr:extracellular solute-binding protein [Oscillospiraceae bacterium]
MNTTKKLLAMLLAISVCAPFCACGKDDESSSSSSSSVSVAERDESQQETLKSVTERFTDYLIENEGYASAEDIKLENPTIKWLSWWDINPQNDGDTISTDLQLFQDVYGGTVEYHVTEWGARFDTLATSIIGGEGIDFFSACDPDIFPKTAIKGQFVPFDDYIDLESELWEDTSEFCDMFTYDGGHYVAVCDVGPAAMCIYNKNTISSNGLPDPAELYRNDEWNWDTFKELCESFVSLSDTNYGIDSWYYEDALVYTCGDTLITLNDGFIESNLYSTNIERAQNFLYDLSTSTNVYLPRANYNWTVQPQMLGEGNLLFYVSYNWDLGKSAIEQYGGTENVMIVPMPRDPEADEYYHHCSITAYSFVKNGQNPEGVAAYLTAKKYAQQTEELQEISIQDQRDSGWSDEMIEMYADIKEMVLENPVYDFSQGCSADLQALITEGQRAAATGITWTEKRTEIETAFQTEIDAVNAQSAEGE